MEKGIETPRRLGTAAALALTTAMAGSSVAAESSQPNEDHDPSLSTTTAGQFSPECNPFYNVDQALKVNPIIPEDHIDDVAKVKSGEATYEDLPYGVYKFMSEKPEEAGVIFDIDSTELDELPTPEEIAIETLGEEYCPIPNEDENLDPENITEANATSSSISEILDSENADTKQVKIDPQPRIDSAKIVNKLQKKYKKEDIKYSFGSDNPETDLITQVNEFFEMNTNIKDEVTEVIGDPTENMELCSEELEKKKLKKRDGYNCIPGLATLTYAYGITGNEDVKEYLDSYIKNTAGKLPDTYEQATTLLLHVWQTETYPEIFKPQK